VTEETHESDEPTKEELYEKAQELDVEGRSTMDKAELAEAVEEAEEADDTEEAEAVESASTENVTDTGWKILSRAEEEEAQHERRRQADAEVEGAAKAAKTTPF